jgi:DNA-binding GntR family transcriptional regulator
MPRKVTKRSVGASSRNQIAKRATNGHGATSPSGRVSIRERTYAVLKEMILEGELRPSERLSEMPLAERLGVSRTPLREALMKLEEEGLIVGQRNVGYKVVDLDVTSVRNLLVVREALDVCAAREACSAANDDDLYRIQGILEEMRQLRRNKKTKPADAARDLELGLKIHEIIAASTRNEALIRLSGQIYQQLQLALWLEVLWVDWLEVGFSEHEAIAAAIIARDPVAAAKAARAHVRTSLKNMSQVAQILSRRRPGRSAEAS